MSPKRDDMRQNTVFFTFDCTNCGENVSGGQPELIHAVWEDGLVDQHSACGKCAVVIKEHNAKVEAAIEAKNPKPPKPVQQATPVAKAVVSAVATDPLAQALLLIHQGQQAIIQKLDNLAHPTLPPPAPEPKKANAKPARTTRRR